MYRKKNREKQVDEGTISFLVPEKHIVRAIDKAIDFRFIYEEVEGLYSEKGQPGKASIKLVCLSLMGISKQINFSGSETPSTSRRKLSQKGCTSPFSYSRPNHWVTNFLTSFMISYGVLSSELSLASC